MSYSYTFTGEPASILEEYNGIVKRTDYTYDKRRRLISETTTVSNAPGTETANSGTNATITYGYDALGNLICKTYSNGVTETISHNILRRGYKLPLCVPFSRSFVQLSGLPSLSSAFLL